MAGNTQLLVATAIPIEPVGFRGPALSSFAPNKPNFRRFWLKNASRPEKETQFARQTQSPDPRTTRQAVSRTTPVASGTCEELKSCASLFLY